MADEDDLMAFLAEVNEAKPAEGEEAAAAAASDTGSPGGGKRAREEDEAAPQQQVQVQVTHPPVVKKAKVIVAKAKPQIFTPQDQEAAAAAAAAAAASITASLPSTDASNYPTSAATAAAPHVGFVPPALPGVGVQQSSGFVTGEAAAAMANKKPKKFVRVGASKEETWEDATLNEWPDNDFRLFCGDLGNDVTDEVLANAFRHKYPSFAKAKVIRDKHKGKSKGFGFVSFMDPFEGLKALREMNLKYIGSRPVKLRKSDWKDRNLKEVKKKEKQKQQFLNKLGLS